MSTEPGSSYYPPVDLDFSFCPVDFYPESVEAALLKDSSACIDHDPCSNDEITTLWRIQPCVDSTILEPVVDPETFNPSCCVQEETVSVVAQAQSLPSTGSEEIVIGSIASIFLIVGICLKLITRNTASI